VGRRDPQGELIELFVDAVHAVATSHQFVGGIRELHHDVVAGNTAQEGGLTCENDLVDRRT
jgi:hypothetical protein